MRKVKQTPSEIALTGKVQYRQDFFKNLLLQVEEHQRYTHSDSSYVDQLVIRDATRFDLQQLNTMGRSPHAFAESLINKEGTWLTGGAFHQTAILRDKIVLFVEEFENTISDLCGSYRRAKITDLFLKPA